MFRYNFRKNIHFEVAFCKACQEPCPLCKSLCFLEISHNGSHDTFHQPDDIIGMDYFKGNKLSAMACNTTPLDHCFILQNEEKWKYTYFSKKFTSWMHLIYQSMLKVLKLS